MQKLVYNLEFPPRCRQLDIYSYRFTRVDKYQERLHQLHRLVHEVSEFELHPTTGIHSQTAWVELPESEEAPILKWAGERRTALDDLFILLSLFTRRHVFALTNEESSLPIVADPRTYRWGGILRVSLPYEESPGNDPGSYDIGFQRGMNEVYTLMRTPEWQNEYRNGYVLFLARQAFSQHVLEAAFTQCWTMWEHLFAVLNSNWLSKEQIIKMPSNEKIAFLMIRFNLLTAIDNQTRTRLGLFVDIRNRLVHFGCFPITDEPLSTTKVPHDPIRDIHDRAVLFIHLTEFIVTKVLGLTPSEVLDTTRKLHRFLE